MAALASTPVEYACRRLVAWTGSPIGPMTRYWPRYSLLRYLRGRHNVAGTPAPEGIINPPIDDLLKVVDSKYGLVIMASKRARQINAYYAQLARACWSTSARLSRPASRRSRSPSRCARSANGC